MNKVRMASLALAAFAVSFGSVVMADCGGGRGGRGGNGDCGGRQGLFAKLHARKAAGGCNGGGGLFGKLKGRGAGRCGGAPDCCAPAPDCCPAPAPACCPAPAPAPCCPAPAPSCGCDAPAPNCGCAAPAPSCGCGAPAPSCGCGGSMGSYGASYNSGVNYMAAPVSGCSSCGNTMDAGVINSSTIVPPAPAPNAAPASVSDKAPAA